MERTNIAGIKLRSRVLLSQCRFGSSVRLPLAYETLRFIGLVNLGIDELVSNFANGF